MRIREVPVPGWPFDRAFFVDTVPDDLVPDVEMQRRWWQRAGYVFRD